MIEGRVDSRRFGNLMGKLTRLAGNPQRAMDTVATDMLNNISYHFEKESNGSQRWDDIETKTRERRPKGKYNNKIMQVSGSLKNRIESSATRYYAAARADMIYAGTMEHGAKKGQYGSTSKGQPIPFGDIPARPFMKQSDEEIARHAETIRNYLTGV